MRHNDVVSARSTVSSGKSTKTSAEQCKKLLTPPTVAVNELVARESSSTSRKMPCSSAEIICKVGVQGYRRIAERAVREARAQRIRKVFVERYEAFREEWGQKKRQYKKDCRSGVIGVDPTFARDSLQAFAEDVLEVDRATANRYLNGGIQKLPLQSLDDLLMKMGFDLSAVIVPIKEKKRAILSATASAMLKARGVPQCHLWISQGEFDAIDWIVERCPLPDHAAHETDSWKAYLEFATEIAMSADSNEIGSAANTPRSHLRQWMLAVVAGDWQAAKRNKWLPWQIAVAILTLQGTKLGARVVHASPSVEAPDRKHMPKMFALFKTHIIASSERLDQAYYYILDYFRPMQAIRQLMQDAKERDEKGVAMVVLGFFYLRERKPAAAIPALERACALLEPYGDLGDMSEAHSLLARALFRCNIDTLVPRAFKELWIALGYLAQAGETHAFCNLLQLGFRNTKRKGDRVLLLNDARRLARMRGSARTAYAVSLKMNGLLASHYDDSVSESKRALLEECICDFVEDFENSGPLQLFRSEGDEAAWESLGIPVVPWRPDHGRFRRWS